ncbi:MAG: DUF2459 domain-containing protein [Spirochaetia bacterium]
MERIRYTRTEKLHVLRTVLEILAVIPLGAAGIVFLYAALGIFLTVVPVNLSYNPPEEGTTAYVISNDVHTSICLPVRTKYTDWLEFINLPEERFEGTADLYAFFGWGDREFFVRTPTWADLTLNTALESLFWPTDGTMLLSFFRGPFEENRLQAKLILSDEELRTIEGYIKESFLLSTDGEPIELSVEEEILRKWGRNEFFYLARYHYHLFFTCNNWTNRGLKRAGIRTSLWAPFERSVLWHLRQGSSLHRRRDRLQLGVEPLRFELGKRVCPGKMHSDVRAEMAL